MLNNVGLFLKAGEKVLNNFKSRIFPIKDKIPTPEYEPVPEPASNPKVFDTPKSKRKILPIEFLEKILNETVKEEKNINNQIFKEYYHYQALLFLANDLYEGNQDQNDKIDKYLNKSLTDLGNSVDSKEIAGNKNPNKIIDIEARLFGFKEQKKSRGLKILTLKQMLQITPIRKNI